MLDSIIVIPYFFFNVLTLVGPEEAASARDG